MTRFVVLILACTLIVASALACQSGCSAIQVAPPVAPVPTASTPPASTAEGGVETAPVECEWLPSSRAATRAARAVRIVGGQPSPARNFPWAVALETSSGWQYCAGSVIAQRWVLTAAHCQVSPGDVVHAGTDDLESPGQRIDVIEARNHPDWYSTTSGHDVAVLRLAADVNVPAVTLATTTPASGVATAVGWGALCEGCSGSPVQRYVEVPLLSHAECRDAYGLAIDDTMLCAGAAGKDSCQGDSGGPLVVQATQIGIVSWGEGCARPEAPGVYTQVAAARDWIEACTP
jgi:trypsin